MNDMKKQINFSINYTENLYKIMQLIETNINVCVVFLLNIWTKLKVNLFIILKTQVKLNFFSHNSMKFQSRT